MFELLPDELIYVIHYNISGNNFRDAVRLSMTSLRLHNNVPNDIKRVLNVRRLFIQHMDGEIIMMGLGSLAKKKICG